MKVGDLVKWSDLEQVWQLYATSRGKDLTESRQRGIIIDKNPRRFFVFWETGEVLAQCPSDIEVVSEGR